MNRAWVISQIYRAIDEVNLQLPADQQVEKSEQTVLAGPAGALDSLSFINLIVTTEEKINESSGAVIPLASRLIETERDRLPRTIAELAEMICERLDDQRDV